MAKSGYQLRHVYLSVHPHVVTRLKPEAFHEIWSIFGKYVEKIN